MKNFHLLLGFAIAGVAIVASHPALAASERAVREFNPEEGFKMTDRSLRAIGAEFMTIRGSAPWQVPASSLVRIKHATGVYRRYEGWISYVIVQVAGKRGSDLLIRSEDLQDGDEIATGGTTYLRMTDADLNADTVDNCAH